MSKKAFSVMVLVCILTLSLTVFIQWEVSHGYPVRITYNLPKVVETSTTQEGELTRVNINTATKDQLMAIPRVGEVTAEKILSQRQSLGVYTSLGQLKEIPGIGEKTYNEICKYLFI